MNNLKFNVQMAGYLENNPTITNFSGRKMANLSIITLDVIKQDGRLIRTTRKHNAIAWNELAELVENKLTKGSEIMFEGVLINKQSGKINDVKELSDILINSFMYRNIEQVIEKNNRA